MDGGIVEILTEGWSDDFKQAVLERLTSEDEKAVHALAPLSFPSLASTAKPEVTTPESALLFVEGDKVEVVNNRKLAGKQLVISTIDDSGIWLREQKSQQGFSRPHGAFQPEQLRKC